ncbi:hypothetical protein IQ264_07325 [Phormidium sp. LEGE 05292]|uniref:hypothetical protein n=1 Tax=[Phormidium] sp. LEGE 05292 TaxID=767427 RepID=UPI0018805B66|nr:hypothetical protein [Phormidium sp. LEGE 05292]MBE9225242.1 hypothetical protein [Phormidium sp. LEGE 05292]
MKLLLIASELIMISGFLIFYSNLKPLDSAKSRSEIIILAEAVPQDDGSPDTRDGKGKGKGRASRFKEDITKEIKFC